MGEILAFLAGRQDDRVMGDAGGVEPLLERGEMQGGDVAVGDDDGALLRHQRRHQRAGAGDQPAADEDVVAAPGEGDGDGFEVAHLNRPLRAVRRLRSGPLRRRENPSARRGRG
jgi:hypothetical protein